MSTKSKGIVIYLLITFGIAWVLWTIPIRFNVSTPNLLLLLAMLPLTGLPGGLAPALAAIVVRKWVTHEGFADAGLKWNLRDKWPYYLFAWLSPLAVALVIALLAIALGISRPEFSLQRAYVMTGPEGNSSSLDSPHLTLIVLIELLIVALVSTPILWGEEFGWRGYLQVRLLSRRPLLAAVVTGLIWGVWHYPFFFLRADNNGANQSALTLLVFPTSTILLSVIFGWLRQRTGSVWATSLAHAATNYIGANLATLWFTGDTNWILWSYLGVLGWVPLGALCGWIILSGQLEPAKDSAA